PFIGGRRIRGSLGDHYFDWIMSTNEDSSGNADLVSYFFRRTYSLLRQKGCFGLIATNSISQGDTRATGLTWIRHQGGTIFAAQKRYAWPGHAAVIVSIVWVTKQSFDGPFFLDGKIVPTITAFLFHAGGDDNPSTLLSNWDIAYQGVVLAGSGFLFE